MVLLISTPLPRNSHRVYDQFDMGTPGVTKHTARRPDPVLDLGPRLVAAISGPTFM